MKTREEGGEESAGVKNRGGWRRCVCVCVCEGGLVDLQIFLVAQIKQKRDGVRGGERCRGGGMCRV